jgi:hypothetical protein
LETVIASLGRSTDMAQRTVKFSADKERRWREEQRNMYEENFYMRWTKDPSALANRNPMRQLLEPSTNSPLIVELMRGTFHRRASENLQAHAARENAVSPSIIQVNKYLQASHMSSAQKREFMQRVNETPALLPRPSSAPMQQEVSQHKKRIQEANTDHQEGLTQLNRRRKWNLFESTDEDIFQAAPSAPKNGSKEKAAVPQKQPVPYADQRNAVAADEAPKQAVAASDVGRQKGAAAAVSPAPSSTKPRASLTKQIARAVEAARAAARPSSATPLQHYVPSHTNPVERPNTASESRLHRRLREVKSGTLLTGDSVPHSIPLRRQDPFAMMPQQDGVRVANHNIRNIGKADRSGAEHRPPVVPAARKVK